MKLEPLCSKCDKRMNTGLPEDEEVGGECWACVINAADTKAQEQDPPK